MTNKRQFKKVSYCTEDVILPVRKTKNSAGYDFISPVDKDVLPGEVFEIKTNIKVYMNEDDVLLLLPRSSYGYKYQMALVNTIGVIDSDYVDNESNEGNIFIRIKNNGDKVLPIRKGEAFVQGIFTKFLITNDDLADSVRTGGIGSTDK